MNTNDAWYAGLIKSPWYNSTRADVFNDCIDNTFKFVFIQASSDFPEDGGIKLVIVQRVNIYWGQMWIFSFSGGIYVCNLYDGNWQSWRQIT